MEHLLFITAFLMVLVYGQDGNVEDLFWCEHTDLSDQMTNCQKGNLRVEVLRTSSTASVSSGFVDYEELLLGATVATCRQIDEYATQLMCKHNVMEECLHDDYKNLLPDKFRLADAARYLCQNVYDLNDMCLMDYMINMGECLLGMGFQNPGQVQSLTVTDKMCKQYSYAETCVATTFRPCGSTALKIYRNTMVYLVPLACNTGKQQVITNSIVLILTLCVTLVVKVL